jgi:anthranilate synthase component I
LLSADTQRTAADLQAWPLGVLTSDELLQLHAAHPTRYPFLLESTAASLQGMNHDLLLAFPGARLELRADTGLSAKENPDLARNGDFLDGLDQWWRQERIPEMDASWPFKGGWFVYLSYELVQQIEPSLRAGMWPDRDQLIAQAVRIPAALERRSDTGESWFVTETGSDAVTGLQRVKDDLQQIRSRSAIQPRIAVLALQEDPPEAFTDAVRTALGHIAAGDIYQANLSRRWHAEAAHDCAPALYSRLKTTNPAPFAALAQLAPDHHLISSSPERLIELRGGWANTRPIAGTRPRHTDARTDQALLDELHAHPKERAEHIMLLDLERNDLGRICVGGTVEVNEYMSIESYAHVHHIVSNVRGRVRSDVTAGQAIAAVFPGGTITGCPKIRCMEIIASLEQCARGAYTGSMGYLNRDGSMDMNILIRTLELRGSQLDFRAGAGIVADSIPERELDETRAKALGLLRALQD